MCDCATCEWLRVFFVNRLSKTNEVAEVSPHQHHYVRALVDAFQLGASPVGGVACLTETSLSFLRARGPALPIGRALTVVIVLCMW